MSIFETAPLVLDLPSLLSRCMGNHALASKLVRAFATALPSELESIGQSLDDRQWDSLARQCHRLKGSSSSLGAIRFSSAVGQLEQLTRSADFDPLPMAWQEVTLEGQRLLKELETVEVTP